MLIVEIKVVPQSGRSQFVLDKSGILKCFIKAAPEKGKANEEVITLLAQKLQIPKGSFEIISGWTIKKKLIKIQAEITYEQFLDKIGVTVQQSIK